MTYRKGCQKIYLLTVFFHSQSGLDYSLTFIGFPLVLESLCLQMICKCQRSQHCSSVATPKNSERFEISCPRSKLSKYLNTGIPSAFISPFYSCLLFMVLVVFSPPLLVPQLGPKLPCNKPCTYLVSP